MSDTSQGDGWWQASDDLWYPPEDRPESRPPPPPSSGMASDSPGSTRPHKRNILIFAGAGVVAVLALIGVLVSTSHSAPASLSATSGTDSTTTTLSPVGSCSVNLYNWIIFDLNNRYSDDSLATLGPSPASLGGSIAKRTRLLRTKT